MKKAILGTIIVVSILVLGCILFTTYKNSIEDPHINKYAKELEEVFNTNNEAALTQTITDFNKKKIITNYDGILYSIDDNFNCFILKLQSLKAMGS